MFESLLLSTLHILSNNLHEVIAIISPILQLKKLRLREVKEHTQSHQISKIHGEKRENSTIT